MLKNAPQLFKKHMIHHHFPEKQKNETQTFPIAPGRSVLQDQITPYSWFSPIVLKAEWQVHHQDHESNKPRFTVASRITARFFSRLVVRVWVFWLRSADFFFFFGVCLVLTHPLKAENYTEFVALPNVEEMYVCMYACMHVCMYACMHVCMYACMHVCMYVCMYVCMCVCMNNMHI